MLLVGMNFQCLSIGPMLFQYQFIVDFKTRSLTVTVLHFVQFIFRRDLRWCPTFNKLKNLLLNDWCVQPDLRALVWMLAHSPVLENLTLQLRKVYLF